MDGGEELNQLLAALHKEVNGAKNCRLTRLKAPAPLTQLRLRLQSPEGRRCSQGTALQATMPYPETYFSYVKGMAKQQTYNGLLIPE